MKRLSMAALLIIALSTGAVAHQGSIGMFTDQSATDCDATFTPYVTADITIMYFKSDAGPDGITAAEFRVAVPDGQMVITGFEASPLISVTMGDIGTGIACTYSGCQGIGSDYLLIGTVTVMTMVDVPMQVRIMVSGAVTVAPFEPRVAICEYPRPVAAVLGGWFCLPDGTCNPGTEEKTWGAIKEMYKD